MHGLIHDANEASSANDAYSEAETGVSSLSLQAIYLL